MTLPNTTRSNKNTKSKDAPDFVPADLTDGGQVVDTSSAAVPEIMTSTVASLYNEEDLRNVTSFDEAIALFSLETKLEVIEAHKVLGDGFAILKDKRLLCGVPLFFMEWNFYRGDFGSEFVAARVAVRNPDGGTSKYIFNDGSSGVCQQLKAYTEKTGRRAGLLARHGLRSSDYTVEVDGVEKTATTFYIDSAV